ncbi:MAG TPA: DnaT-like ssDNA-binding protein [Candidatus Limnocylindrales bacterium]|nr:DnaT-like ssDNA-binding protein [Candidatus Limnocylindrales bacterium]
MPLDTTVAGAATDSYISVAEADAMAAADLGRFAEAWAEHTPDKKERALRRATREIDSHYGSVRRYAATQARSFPRSLDVASGVPFVPDGIARATYEQAIYVASNAHLLDDAASRLARGLVSFSSEGGSGTVMGSEDVQYGRLAPNAARWLEVVRGRGTRSGRGVVSSRLSSAGRW